MTQRGTARVLSLVLAKMGPNHSSFLVGWSSRRKAFILSDRLQRMLLPHTYRSVNFDIQKSVNPAKRIKEKIVIDATHICVYSIRHLLV